MSSEEREGEEREWVSLGYKMNPVYTRGLSLEGSLCFRTISERAVNKKRIPLLRISLMVYEMCATVLRRTVKTKLESHQVSWSKQF